MTELFLDILRLLVILTVVIITVATVRLYRNVAIARALQTTPWPLRGMLRGSHLLSHFDNSMAEKIPLTGFVVLADANSSETFSLTTMVSALSTRWQCDFCVLTEGDSMPTWIADLGERDRKCVIVEKELYLKKLLCYTLPTVLFLRSGRVVDGINGHLNMPQLVGHFEFLVAPAQYVFKSQETQILEVLPQ